MENTETKVCSKCGLTKNINEFQWRNMLENKKRNECRSCRYEHDKNTRYKNRKSIDDIPKDIKCNHCGLVKSSSEYSWWRKCLFIKKHTCKECDKKYQRAIRVDRKEYALLEKARKRAAEKGWEFDITIDDIVIPDICPILGIPINRNNKEVCDTSPSLDRIDSSKGYVKGNVLVVSHRGNTIKNYGNIEEHEKVVEYMRKKSPLDFPCYSV